MSEIGYTPDVSPNRQQRRFRLTEYDPATEGETGRRPTVAELFAGVGGFHLALDRAGFDVVWSNQWEPATRVQHAFDCYERHVEEGDFQRFGRGLGAPHDDLGLVEHVGRERGHREGPRRVRGAAVGPKRPVFASRP